MNNKKLNKMIVYKDRRVAWFSRLGRGRIANTLHWSSVATLGFTLSLLVGHGDVAMSGTKGPLFTPIIPFADLALTEIQDTPDPVEPNQTFTYTATVRNFGPFDTTGVVYSHSVNIGLELLNATFVDASGTPGSCAPTTGSPAVIKLVTCQLGGIPDQGTATVTIQVRPTQVGLIETSPGISGGPLFPPPEQLDPNATNNQVTVTTMVGAAPSGAPQSVTVAEDTGIVISLFAQDADTPPSSGGGTDLTFALVDPPDNGSLSPIASPQCNPSGAGQSCTADVTYTPGPGFNSNFGAESFTYNVDDGVFSSIPAEITIDVTPVNDAPVFNTIPNQAVKRVDATAPIAPQSLAITGLAPGPAGATDEATQTVSLSVTGNSNPGLITNVVVSGTGATRRLDFQPVGTATGAATIEVMATDSGAGTAPDVNTAVQSFTIRILAPAAAERALSLDLRTAPAEAFAIVQGDAGPVVATGFTGDVIDRALAPGNYRLQLPDSGSPVTLPLTVGTNDCDVSLR